MIRGWTIFTLCKPSALVGSSHFNKQFNWAKSQLQFATKVPQQPYAKTESILPTLQEPDTKPAIDRHTVQLLERLSLVDLETNDALETLEDSIGFASRILTIGTEGVEPLYTVLERERLSLREDVVNDGDLQTDVLRNAAVTEEEYFVAPPGNIPLELQENSRPIAH
ncbi:15E1.2 protein [Anopheles darlingi]|uniref:Glutamyl-tRNA(Gln) amidotransferase subunit C, mitochondrial n=1 Tax=Anopheles darlingi TaxID=43151 RepID=GATC_ANODA|nr:glutamyl-tRNA(Gln) amidotransferase subunit C, mitochondrial [Anopheles darlingi]E3WSB5.2 RecName: Full=Glutamyl-tRNA(Gln) amidotransferase subunit C, mitochondrial; Short=Glu-AdT subunit C; Flags: Precursor [Anopheles darlingi]ETN67598.1 15E1.2 protein [Anopheles darlingi]